MEYIYIYILFLEKIIEVVLAQLLDPNPNINISINTKRKRKKKVLVVHRLNQLVIKVKAKPNPKKNHQKIGFLLHLYMSVLFM